MADGLVFRTRMSDDITICDYCRHYKCAWMESSPRNYPRQCPEAREFRIAAGKIERAELLRRAQVARRVGIFRPQEKKWLLCAERARGLTAGRLAELMADIRAWSGENDFALSGMIRYDESPRESVPPGQCRGGSGRRTVRASAEKGGKGRTVQTRLA